MNKFRKIMLNLWYGLPFGLKGADTEIMGSKNIDSNGSNENNDSNDSNESFIINSEGKSIKVFFNRDLSSD